MKKNEVKAVFFGTSRFSVLVLEELKKTGFTPALIVTTPDRKQGRNMELTAPPVKTWAEKESIDVQQPETIDKALVAELKNTEWDIFLTASYGNIIPKEILDIPKYGALNVHPSLLPKYRGASPIHSQILEDDRETGITIMLMDEKMDHGPILAQARIEIEEDNWPLYLQDLEELLGTEGGKLLAETIMPWVRKEITAEAQKESEATYTKKVTKEEGELDLEHGDPRKNFLKIHAYHEWPGAYFFTERKGKKIRVKVTGARYSDGSLSLMKVIPEGKKEMSYEDFKLSSS